MATESLNPPIFSGRYDHALDNKNRITIPSRWRQTDSDEFFIMPDLTNSFLIVMPPAEFKSVGDQVSGNPAISPQEKRTFIRHFYAMAQHCSTDKQGRLLIPEEHCKQVALNGEVVLAGTDKRFEIWNPQRWNAAAEAGKSTCEKVANVVGL